MNKLSLVVIFLALTLSVVVVARSIKPANVVNLPNEDQDEEEYTITIRRSDPKEATSGNMYHHFVSYMKALEDSMNKTKERSILGGAPPTGEEPIDWAKVVNIGKQIWDIIVKNQPTIDVKEQSAATVVPGGITDWRQLTGWGRPHAVPYTVEYKNMVGLTVVKFQFQVVYISGGKYQGKGQFLTGLSVVPTDIDVTWSYHFNVKVDVPNVWNAGETVEDPIGAAQINLYLDFNGSKKQVKTWFVKGNGDIDEL